jgi:subtilisin family serine protease
MAGTTFREDYRAVIFESLEPRLLLSGETISAAVASVQWNGASAPARADEWIIRFENDAPASEKIDALGSSLAASGIESWTLDSIGGSQFGVLRAPGFSASQAAAWASKQAGVLYIEPNYVYSISETVSSTFPDDPSMTDGTLWGLHNTGQFGGTADADIDAPEAWDLTTGSADVVIGVIDTGVDLAHPELVDNLWTNPGETPGDGIDNDNNGFIDDVYGWNFVNDDNDPMDGHNHGTHVSGTIGGVGNDGNGMTGVSWDVSIMALKFLDDSGSGSTEDAIAAIDYAAMMKRDYGVNVVATNNSWGGGGYSTALLDAIENAGREGILFVAAASNEGLDNDVYANYPSSYDSQYILSVAATDRNDQLADFSNYGVTTVDIGAPGVSIYSSISGGGYAWFEGTSMAAPHAAGVAALLAAHEPGATVGEIRQAIINSVDPIAALDGYTVTGGRLNAFGALLALGSTGPRVMSASPSGVSGAISEITVYFSEDIAPASIVGANFSLRDNGADDIFDTADDNEFAIGDTDLGLVGGDVVVISLAGDLDVENYRLTITGTGLGPVRDLDGNALNDGASDHEHFFQILAASGDLEPNDTIDTATPSGLTGTGQVAFSAEIGDGLWGYNDVDIYRLDVPGPMTLVAETDTDLVGSDLDTILRLFDADGNELAFNDDTDFPDSEIQYAFDTAGEYYLGVSGYSNFDYDPLFYDSWFGDSIGQYYLTIKLLGSPEIRGAKWDDRNADGVRGAGESPVVGATIFLDSDLDGVLDAGEASTVTDAEGNYAFEDLQPGMYVVDDVADSGWIPTYPSTVAPESYAAHTTALQFEDISTTGQAVLVGEDDESHYLSSVDLGGFEFPLYGASYDEIYINTNGLLSFIEPATSWLNGDLSLYPEGAAIAVFWDDLIITGTLDSAVYWEVRGSGADERLIIQWHEVDFYDELDPGALTFQAVLRADGHISLNYSDVTSPEEGSEGEFATVGAKGSLFFGHRVLLSYNSGPGQFVGTGISTHIRSPLVGQHVVTLEPGQVENNVLFGSRRDIPFGDANADGTVDQADVEIFANEFGTTGLGIASDHDGDGDVDLGDFTVLRNSFNGPAASPEPAGQIASAAVASSVQAASDHVKSAAGSIDRGSKRPKKSSRRSPLLTRAVPEFVAAESAPIAPDIADLLVATPVGPDVAIGGVRGVSPSVETPSDRAVRLMDRGDPGANSISGPYDLDLDDLLDSVLVDLFG